jgi:hypothetical protein
MVCLQYSQLWYHWIKSKAYKFFVIIFFLYKKDRYISHTRFTFHNKNPQTKYIVKLLKKTRGTHRYSFETRPGPPGRPGTGPTRGWNRAGWRKNRVKKNPVWPGQKPGCNPLTFVFLLKRYRFDLKKRIDTGDPVTRSKPETRTLNLEPSRIKKNYAHI